MGATNLFPSLCPCVLPLIGSDTKIDDTEIILDEVKRYASVVLRRQ